MLTQVLSTYQVANLCNVHHTTVINWVNDGVLKAYTTPGGHRRIRKDDVVTFMKDFEMPVPKELSKSTKLVLIIDDDPEALWELKEALGNISIKLDFALNGFEAGRKIYRKKPDLILLDFKMPGMDGFQVCEALHRDNETAHIPIIATTILNSEEDINRITELGVCEYLAKPIDIEKLKEIIKKILK